MLELRAAPTFGGLAILVVGLLMINFGAYSYTVEVPRIETRPILSGERLSQIGDFVSKEIDLRNTWIVNLEGKVEILGSNGSGAIDLYVMNSREYQRWRNGEKDVEYLVKRERVDRFNGTFVPTENGTYYVTFDNRFDPKYKKEVTFTARYTFETRVPETRQEDILTKVGYPLAVLGAISLIYGLVRKPDVKWE